MGRKRQYNREKLLPLILDRIAAGETLVSIADDVGVARRTVYDWLAASESAHLAHAREAGADTLAMQALAIADDSSRDTIETDRGPICDREWIARSKLRVDTRLKLAAVFCPAKYGQKAQLEHSGPNGGAMQQVTRVEIVALTAENGTP
jgi:transposase-like protein